MKGPSAMTQSIDQAPNNNPDNNRGDDERRNHPELVQGSQDFFGGTPANLYDGPAPIDRDPRKKTRRNLFIAAGATVGTVAATGALYLGAKHEVRDIANDLYNPLPASSAPVVPGQESSPSLAGDYDGNGVVTSEEYDKMPPEEFASLDDRIRVEDVAAKLNHYMPTAYTEIQRHLTGRESSALYMPDVNKPRSQWTDQDYLNYYTLGLYLVSTQGNQQSQIDEGRRALTVVMDPDHPNFSAMNTSIGTANGVKSVYEAEPSPYAGKELTSGTYGDYSIGGEGGRLVLATYIPGDAGQKEMKQYMLFVNRSDNEGNIASILVDSFTTNDPRVKNIFQQ